MRCVCRFGGKEAAAAVHEESLRVGKERRSRSEEKGQERAGGVIRAPSLITDVSVFKK